MESIIKKWTETLEYNFLLNMLLHVFGELYLQGEGETFFSWLSEHDWDWEILFQNQCGREGKNTIVKKLEHLKDGEVNKLLKNTRSTPRPDNSVIFHHENATIPAE